MAELKQQLTFSQKLGLALNGRKLTPQQGARLEKTLARTLKRKSEADLTIPELQGLIKIVETILPAGWSKQ